MTRDSKGQPHLSVKLFAGVGILCTSQNQCFVDTAVIQSKANALSGAATQNCVSNAGNTLDYKAACSFALPKLEKNQTLNWFVDIANTGAVTLSVDTLPPMPACDRNGNQITGVGQLTPGLWHIWNDGARWIISDAI